MKIFWSDGISKWWSWVIGVISEILGDVIPRMEESWRIIWDGLEGFGGKTLGTKLKTEECWNCNSYVCVLKPILAIFSTVKDKM